MTRAELKAKAKNQIKGNIGILFVISLIVSAITGAVSATGIGAVATFILTPAFAISIQRIYLNLAKDIKPQVRDTFNGFDDFWSAFKVTFFIGLFTFLWSLLFVIPGIIKAFSYAQALNIVSENPGMPALEAIDRSKKMMCGHKMDLFILGLSFIGWLILCAITFGIAYIWVGPYMQATYINFYNAIKPAPEVTYEEPSTDETPAVE